MDKNEKQIFKNPRENAGIISIMTFAWLYKIFRLGFSKKLEISDIYSVLPEQSIEVIGQRIFELWRNKKRGGNNHILIKVLAHCFGKEFIIHVISLIISRLILRTIEPFILIKVLNYFKEKPEMKNNEIYYWASGLIILKITISIMFHLFFLACAHIALKVNVACFALIYKKILKLSKSSLENETSVGQVVNILSHDVRILNLFVYHGIYLFFAPIQVIVLLGITYNEMGFAPIVGLSTLLLTLPGQGLVGKMLGSLMKKCVSLTDERLCLMSEIINGIQLIKMYTWEKPFSYLVEKTRRKELNVIKKMSIIGAIVNSFTLYVPQICLFITVLSGIAFGRTLSAEKVYMLASFYSEIRFCIYVMFNDSLQYLAKVIVSLRRIEAFMNCQEKEDHLTDLHDQSDDNQISIKISQLYVKWLSSDKEETLKNINLTLKHGKITSIIGKVGSGKSSLLKVILGEIPAVRKGSVQVFGKISYASQEPWVFASSIKQNILFGQPKNKERYEKVIRVCQLEQDIESLPFGDETLIGEKGIKLSGGQRARINLARAVYFQADIYLIDDPLSAVDSQVAERIFKDCIIEFLKDKTRILVTHQLQYLKMVDQIILLRNGFLLQMESTDVVDSAFSVFKTNLDFVQMLKVDEHDQKTQDTTVTSSSSIHNREENPRLMDKHDIIEQMGKVSSESKTGKKSSKYVLWSYLKAVANPWIVLITIIFGISYQMFLSGGDYFLSRWMNAEEASSITDENATNHTFIIRWQRANPATHLLESQRWWYIQICIIFYVSLVVSLIGFLISFYTMCMISSKRLHQSMLSNIIHAKMMFFYENECGRILNRFSKDIGTLDKELPDSVAEVSYMGLELLAASIVTFIFKPASIIIALLIGIPLYILRNIYIRTSNSVKHLEATTRSPVLNHVTATLEGLITIRALKAEAPFQQQFNNHQNLHTSAQFIFISSTRAFGYYVELLTLLFIGSVIYLLILFSDHILVGDAGLIITQWFQLCYSLQWGVRQSTEVENQLTSVERVLEYTNLDSELIAPFEIKRKSETPEYWPSDGKIEFKKVFLKYHPRGVAVLRNLNFIILPKEKIGIVGRTGSGKTSLIAALFRLAYVDGEIYIDDVETSCVGLNNLRSNISIIPQQPLLFTGTLRSNLDPFKEYSDQDLWQALEDVQLTNFFKEMEIGLDFKVSDGGSNFSVGQRQLLSLARVILRKKKILVLDEATANIDLQTDELIQKTIRSKFKDSTVFIIAHRLNTVMDCDKFIVMDEGRMVEFDHPHLLLQNKKGYLYSILQQTGSEMAEILKTVAAKSFHDKEELLHREN